MRNKYIIGVMTGLLLGSFSQPIVVYGDDYQEKTKLQPPKEAEPYVYPDTEFVPRNLKSAVIATPRYPMSESVSKVITMVDTYLYDESKYSPSVIVSRLPDGKSDNSTPEKTMFSRTTAMINGDYDLFSSYWDKESLAFTEQHFTINKITPEKMVGNWVGTFRQLNMVMLRRIDIGGYVVLIYDMEQKTGEKEKLGGEFPVIFQKNGQEWQATQALRADDLIITAPWVSGEYKIEITMR